VTTADGGAARVAWRVATDPQLRDVVAEGITDTDADRDHTVHVDADGLPAGAVLYYGFETLGHHSLVGRTRTAPAGPADRLRFAVVSCASWTWGWFGAYGRVADRDDLDAVIHVGDYIYEYGDGASGPGAAIGRVHVPAHECVTLADYRARYAYYRTDLDLLRLHQQLPMIVVWDDHEFADNAWVDGAGAHDDADGDWEARKAAAARAFREWLPVRLPDPSDPMRIHRSLPYGDLVELLMLDTRIAGRDEPVAYTGEHTIAEPATNDPQRSLLGDAQRAWLYQRLGDSTAQWKIVGQQVICAQINAGGLPRLPGLDAFGLRQGGNAINADAWDGYTAERDRLLGHIRDSGVQDVVVLSGDLHTSWAFDLVEDPYDPTRYVPLTGAGAAAVEFVTPSVTSENFDENLGYPPGTLGPVLTVPLRADNPHLAYVDPEQHGYLLLDVTPERVQADWWYVATRDEPDSPEAYGASYQVASGTPHVIVASGPVQDRDDVPPPAPAEPPPPDPDASETPSPRATPAGPAGPLPTTGGGAAAAAVLGALGLSAVIRRRSQR